MMTMIVISLVVLAVATVVSLWLLLRSEATPIMVATEPAIGYFLKRDAARLYPLAFQIMKSFGGTAISISTDPMTGFFTTVATVPSANVVLLRAALVAAGISLDPPN